MKFKNGTIEFTNDEMRLERLARSGMEERCMIAERRLRYCYHVAMSALVTPSMTFIEYCAAIDVAADREGIE